MSDNQMLYCLIAFILGWLVYRHMGDGFSVGAPRCMNDLGGLIHPVQSPLGERGWPKTCDDPHNCNDKKQVIEYCEWLKKFLHDNPSEPVKYKPHPNPFDWDCTTDKMGPKWCDKHIYEYMEKHKVQPDGHIDEDASRRKCQGDLITNCGHSAWGSCMYDWQNMIEKKLKRKYTTGEIIDDYEKHCKNPKDPLRSGRRPGELWAPVELRPPTMEGVPPGARPPPPVAPVELRPPTRDPYAFLREPHGAGGLPLPSPTPSPSPPPPTSDNLKCEYNDDCGENGWCMNGICA